MISRDSTRNNVVPEALSILETDNVEVESLVAELQTTLNEKQKLVFAKILGTTQRNVFSIMPRLAEQEDVKIKEGTSTVENKQVRDAAMSLEPS